MGQWRKNLNARQRKNSRKPKWVPVVTIDGKPTDYVQNENAKTPIVFTASQTIASLPSVPGVDCGGCGGEVKLLSDVIRLSEESGK